MNRVKIFGLAFLFMVVVSVVVLLQISAFASGSATNGGSGRGENETLQAPSDILIDPVAYVDQFDEHFFRAGDTYNLLATAQSIDIFPNMSHVVFQQSSSNQNDSIWEMIGSDNNTNDTTYSVEWLPDTEHIHIRAISYDTQGNFSISEVFTDFHVDEIGPEAPLTLQADLDLSHRPKAQVSGYIYDFVVESQMSGIDYVVLYVNGEPVMNGTDELHLPVVDFQFEYDLDIDAINDTSGNISNATSDDISYSITARGYDHVGNEGDLSENAIWIDTGRPDAMRVISPSSIRDIPMGETFDDPDDSLDEIRSITVTFLNTLNDYMNYPLSIGSGPLSNTSHITNLDLSHTTKYFQGYFHVEVHQEITSFEAQISIEFHISSRSHLGTTTADILHNTRLITREQRGDGTWKILDLIEGQVQPIDEAKGLYRVQARVDTFGDYVIAVASSDLTVQKIHVDPEDIIGGEEVWVNVTVHHGGDFPKEATNVYVKLFAIDERGNQEYIDELEYGTIDHGFISYPDPDPLSHGSHVRSILWTPSRKEENMNYSLTLRAQVDPDGYVREVSETNNERKEEFLVFTPIDVDPPWLNITGPREETWVSGLIHIYGEVGDDIFISHVESRLDGSDNWHVLNQSSLVRESDRIVWHLYYASSNLRDGPHTFEFRAFDGNQYSEIISIELQVDNSEEDVSSPGFSFLPVLLIILAFMFILLTFVLRTQPHWFGRGSPPSLTDPSDRPSSSSASSPENSQDPDISSSSEPPPPVDENTKGICSSCDAEFAFHSNDSSISITCPHCGATNVSQQFRDENQD